MALFKRNFDKPGPGVPKNAPRKKGIPRFFEVLTRDFGSLVKLNLLFQLCVLPAELALGMCALAMLLGDSPLLFVLIGLVVSIPIGPAFTAMLRGITRMLQDEPGFVWHNFKKDFKSNFRGTVVPGIIYAAIIGAQVMALLMWYISGGDASFVYILLFCLSLFIFWMSARYFFIQEAYLELGGWSILKNSLLLAIGNAPRSLAAAVIGIAFAVLQLLYPLATFPITIFFGYAIPCLVSTMFVWPKVDKTFNIEKTLKERAQQQVEEDAAESGAKQVSTDGGAR